MLKFGSTVIAKKEEIFKVVEKGIERDRARRYQRKRHGVSQRKPARRRMERLLL